jgi:hypothetical protein
VAEKPEDGTGVAQKARQFKTAMDTLIGVNPSATMSWQVLVLRLVAILCFSLITFLSW